jgi:ADP-heptose:LPS heptosyltransferase
VIFDFQGLIKSGVCAWLARSSRRVGFELSGLRETLAGIFITEHVSVPEERRHIIDKNLSLLKTVDIETGERGFPMSVPEEMVGRAEVALDSMGLIDYVVINPGAGWVTKKWSPERYGELAHQIHSHWDLKSLVIWGPGEESAARTVEESSNGAAQMAPLTRLREIIPFLTRSKLFVGGDTGPFHIASALGVPVVGVFGPSDPAQNGPFASEDEVVWKQVSCSPCYKRRCPGLGTVCLTDIEVPEVLEAVRRRLSSKKKIATGNAGGG